MKQKAEIETIEEVKERVKNSQINYESNIDAIEDILLNERGFISKKPYDEDVVALLSGGLDSSVMIDIIIQFYNVKVHPLFFKRGARSERFEEDAFDFFVDFYRKMFPNNIGEATKLTLNIPPKEFKRYFPEELTLTTGHPLRNSTMQNLAVNYAIALNGKYGLNIKTIFSGSIAEDSTEPELGLLSLRSQTLNTCINLGDWEWQITSPLTDTKIRNKPIYKADLIDYAIRSHIPIERTRSCFSDNVDADGTCIACEKRLKAFEYFGIKDPIKYQKRKE